MGEVAGTLSRRKEHLQLAQKECLEPRLLAGRVHRVGARDHLFDDDGRAAPGAFEAGAEVALADGRAEVEVRWIDGVLC